MMTNSMKASARDRIMRSAEVLFAERGYDATSIGEIALRAEVNRALLYYYFRHKEDLYITILSEGIAMLREMTLEAISQQGSAVEGIRAFLRGYLLFSESRPGLVRIVYREIVGAQRQDAQSKQFAQQFVATLTMVRELLQRGIEAGEFRVHDAFKGAVSLFGMMNAFITIDYLEDRHYPHDELVEHVVSTFVMGVQPR
ncbi:MAG: TetR/AcrR family transcriptional regulator [Armatimonadota bacterium]